MLWIWLWVKKTPGDLFIVVFLGLPYLYIAHDARGGLSRFLVALLHRAVATDLRWHVGVGRSHLSKEVEIQWANPLGFLWYSISSRYAYRYDSC